MKLLKLFSILVLTLVTNLQAQDTTNIRVLRVKDGDTFTAIYKDHEETFRVACIDAPESTQLYGPEAKYRLASMTLDQNKDLFVIVGKKDLYGRYIVALPDVSKELVAQGLAWVYLDYCKNKNVRATLSGLQEQAKEQKLGLWSYKPFPPSKYRKLNKTQKLKYQR